MQYNIMHSLHEERGQNGMIDLYKFLLSYHRKRFLYHHKQTMKHAKKYCEIFKKKHSRKSQKHFGFNIETTIIDEMHTVPAYEERGKNGEIDRKNWNTFSMQ